jgi:hypothetical protein
MGEISTLSSIDAESGVAQDSGPEYRGFLTIRATDENGNVFVGQLTPDEARQMALAWLEAAEGAEQDRIVLTMLTRDAGLDPEAAVNFIISMRKEREETRGS